MPSPAQVEANRSMRRSLTIAELGVIVSLVCSVGSLLFTAGILYGDVQRNTRDIQELKPLAERVAKIETGVDYLVGEARERKLGR